MSEQKIPLNEKYSLTIKEAAQYFSIGVKGNRYLILRERFEDYLRRASAI